MSDKNKEEGNLAAADAPERPNWLTRGYRSLTATAVAHPLPTMAAFGMATPALGKIAGAGVSFVKTAGSRLLGRDAVKAVGGQMAAEGAKGAFRAASSGARITFRR